MAHPFTLSGNQIQVSASIGLAAASRDETADDLLRNADVAMYAAKRRGKGRLGDVRVEDVRRRASRGWRWRPSSGPRSSGASFTSYYQPIVELESGSLDGVEALVRWDHPQCGLLLPQHFIPLAEETGLIVPLGAGCWPRRAGRSRAGGWRIRTSQLAMSVNISGRQLQGAGFTEELRDALAATGVDPSAVILEITESVLMQQTESVLDRLRGLKELGIRLAIDDFGTGYSSLSYLQRFPIDILKIAKPFVEEVGQGADRSALARAIIGLGDTLKLHTIAEGIEMAEQRAALIGLGCLLGQGHYFAPALPPDEIERMLTAVPVLEEQGA